MIPYPVVRRVVCLSALLLLPLLFGCGGSLLWGKSAALYRFGMPAPQVGPTPASVLIRRRILLAVPTFRPEIAGDRLLTTQRNQVSYIKGARWVAAAPILYQAVVTAMLRARVPDVEVVEWVKALSAGSSAHIDIDRFEAAYGTDPTAPPVVHIEGRATLVLEGSAISPTIEIAVSQAATANRVSAITDAFDVAVSRSAGMIADFISVNAMAEPLTPRLPSDKVGRPVHLIATGVISRSRA